MDDAKLRELKRLVHEHSAAWSACDATLETMGRVPERMSIRLDRAWDDIVKLVKPEVPA